MFSVDDFWGEILSRIPVRIQDAFAALQPDEQASVLAHLKKMVTEQGWADPQRESARAALDVLEADD